METWKIAVSTALAGFISTLYAKYKSWKAYRNSLDDDIRAEIWWNDQRYERLMLVKRIIMYVLLALSASALLFVIGTTVIVLGQTKGWWH